MGLENVSVIGVVGLIVVPGCGVATALAVAAPAGNQLIRAVRARSHGCRDADTTIEPAAAT